jgi:hypothetical protein
LINIAYGFGFGDGRGKKIAMLFECENGGAGILLAKTRMVSEAALPGVVG